MKLAPNMSIEGDTTGLSYLWEGTIKFVGKNYSAKDFLSNVTIPNPVFINGLPSDQWTKFVLSVSKSDLTFRDSINVRVSQFIYSTGYEEISLYKGDSILLQFTSFGGGIPPYKFLHWENPIGIAHTNEFPTWCRNVGTTTGQSIWMKSYFVDSVGCQVEDVSYQITFLDFASSISVNNKISSNKGFLFQNDPNPFKFETKIKYVIPEQSKVAFIQIRDLNGKQIKVLPITTLGESFVLVKASEFYAGVFIYTLVVDGNIVESKRMVINN